MYHPRMLWQTSFASRTPRRQPARLLPLAAMGIVAMVFLLASQPARAEHHENWIEVKSPHFKIYSNAGEHDGRKVAAEFEQIRALFEQSFPKLRVDFGKPTIVYVLRDENSLKLLMPNYGQNKNGIKLAGFYQTSNDKNFAIVRTDVTGTGANPYHVMYHEWAHGLFRLNFRGLPMWLDEGLAEFWGGSDIDNKEGRVGVADARQLRVLQENQFLPLSTLLSIDQTSPLYNTRDHAGIFYAESWAMVHYLEVDPEVRGQNLLQKYLTALQNSDDPIAAATASFGDLKKLNEQLQNYVRRPAFMYEKFSLHSDISEKNFAARHLSVAEGLMVQADYLVHTNHLPEAIEVLHEAEGSDPKTPRLHDTLGYYHFQKADFDNSAKEFELALAADAKDATAYLYRAYIAYRKTGYNKVSTPQIVANLEKVLTLQPDFAPAHAFLSVAYSQSAETKGKAFAAAKRAHDLEPGNMAYFLDMGRALVATGDLANAKKVAEQAQKTATWTRDRTMAANFAKLVTNKANPQANDTANPGSADPVNESAGAERPAETSEKAGQITELLCGHPPAVMFTLSFGSEQLLLRAKDIGKVEMHDGKGGSEPVACSAWKDRKVKVVFVPTPEGQASGEVQSVTFE